MPRRDSVDILVIGGGVNGTGIARDAAGRGVDVLLCEQGDLAQATSSASSKLIHGGLRYLEYYEFRLVREALAEREVLLRAAPHIVWPLTFVLPHSPALRPAWMIRIGLLLYDNIGGREMLPGSHGVDLTQHPAGAPLRPEFRRGFTYADCWVDDSRLTVLNAVAAHERGAEILTRTRCTGARREDGVWRVELRSELDGSTRTVEARGLVNAAGPWVGRVLTEQLGLSVPSRMRLVKGSHIVVPRLFDHPHPYILQNEDRRIVFAIPYEGAFTLIGTTDQDFEGDPGSVSPTDDEVAYLCEAVSRYFAKPVAPDDVVWSYAGVRPLYDDAKADVSAITRDYVFDIDTTDDQAPLLSVYGGKITTYRRLSAHALDKLRPLLGFRGDWTEHAHLPGGDIPDADFDAFLAGVRAARPWLPQPLAYRLARAYGTRIETILDGAGSTGDLGEDLGEGVFEAELDYLKRVEWAITAEDMLWRRSKLGLHLSDATMARIRAWFNRNTGDMDPSGDAV